MLLHDLMRAALIDPCLPDELLPDDWAGDAARDVAAAIYRAVDAGAWAWLEEVTGTAADVPARFTPP